MKENLIDLGMDGWMADFGEYTPVEARSDYAARYFLFHLINATGKGIC